MNPNHPYDEQLLLQGVSQGDANSFSKLFEHWQPLLALFIFRITRSKELTAEIVQDVFLKIWISREALASIENFKNYLFIVSRNHAINTLRKTLRERQRLNEWSRELSQNTEMTSPADGEARKDRFYTLIDESIEKLPPRQKEVFLLHRHHRLTYVQIAEQLNIGRESVKTHLGLAIRSISKYLTERASILILISAAFKNLL